MRTEITTTFISCVCDSCGIEASTKDGSEPSGYSHYPAFELLLCSVCASKAVIVVDASAVSKKISK